MAARMPHLLHARGDAALAAILERAPLLAFDFDGTLAPIAATPDQARISRSVADRLDRLGARLPIAIVTGRSVADVRERLGFEPRYVIGNHGAEGACAGADVHAAELDGARKLLAACGQPLAAAGVTIEDKQLSLALHYRLSRCPEHARAVIAQVLQPLRGLYRTFPGKLVENIVPPGAPDKGRAVHHLVRTCGAVCAVFVGDDANDEPVFASAPPDWLTIRVGRDVASSRAQWFLDSTAEVGWLLDRMVLHLRA